jgi:predicted nucleic acid-binding protein
MGLLEALEGDRIYLDTNAWIYALEGYSDFRPELTLLFEQIQIGTLTGITSELTLAELLVKPFRDRDQAQQGRYKKAISNRKNFYILPVLRDLLIDAAAVRASTQLKLPDAIHAATALRANCTTFLTNDRQLKKLTDIPVILLSEVILQEG